MASKILTEQEVYNIGKKGSYTSNLCCTYSRAQALGCKAASGVSLSSNQLVWSGSVVQAYEYVDLGFTGELAGLMIGKWNLGADSETGTGKFYSWGNTTGYTEGDNHKFTTTEYNSSNGKKLTGDISPNSTYDPARAELGGSWRLPTAREFYCIYQQCFKNREWTSISGVYGFKVTGPNGNYVFFPACGHCGPNGFSKSSNYYTFYMSSTYSNANEFIGLGIQTNMFAYNGTEARYAGHSVRPVFK